MTTPPAVLVRDLVFAYDRNAVLRGATFTVQAGSFVALIGPNGAGKSTLLNIIGALDRPTSGSILFESRDLAVFSESEIATYRNRQVGFVFQLHHLLPQCTVLENVLLPKIENTMKKLQAYI